MGAHARPVLTSAAPIATAPSLLIDAAATSFQGAKAYGSPAHALQNAIEQEFAARPIRKWPPIVGIGLLAGTSALFWAGVAAAMHAL